MANLLTIFSRGLLQNPGDHLDARVTDTERKVIIIKKGDEKISATMYPSGRVVETKSYVLKDR